MAKNTKPFEIIIFGPPVSGKGTQAQLLAATLEIPHISAGHLLRELKGDKRNRLAAKVAKLIDTGQLVPDEIVTKLVLARLRQADCRTGYILDGYPRTRQQVAEINAFAGLDYVFLIDVGDKVVVERLTGRRACKQGHIWHIKYAPTKQAGVCDICGGRLYRRADDRQEKVLKRLKIYHDNHDSAIKFFAKQGKLIKINGDQHIENVFAEIIKPIVDNLRRKNK